MYQMCHLPLSLSFSALISLGHILIVTLSIVSFAVVLPKSRRHRSGLPICMPPIVEIFTIHTGARSFFIRIVFGVGIKKCSFQFINIIFVFWHEFIHLIKGCIRIICITLKNLYCSLFSFSSYCFSKFHFCLGHAPMRCNYHQLRHLFHFVFDPLN